MRRLVVLVAVASALSGCAFFGGGDSYEVVAEFPRAVSLYERGSVQVLGLPAGEVSDVELLPDRVRVTMRIDGDIPLPLHVQAALVPQSLIGERRIQLFPPYQQGDAIAPDGHEIGLEDTIIPVEPDEALDALKEFLDSLDPNGVGRLVDNAAAALDGQGDDLGTAIDALSGLVGLVEDADEDIVRIAERFDDFASTLVQREGQLAEVLRDFAVVTEVLAAERDDLRLLLERLASLSDNGLDLVSEHAVRLRTDIEIVTRLVASLDANVDAVNDALVAGGALVDGFSDAYDPDLRALSLRNSFGPLAEEALSPVFDTIGIPFPCLPLDVACAAPGDTADEETDDGLPLPLPTESPVSDILELLSAPTVPSGETP